MDRLKHKFSNSVKSDHTACTLVVTLTNFAIPWLPKFSDVSIDPPFAFCTTRVRYTHAHREPHATAGVTRGRALRIAPAAPRPDARASSCIGVSVYSGCGRSANLRSCNWCPVACPRPVHARRARTGASETGRASAGREKRRVKDEGDPGEERRR